MEDGGGDGALILSSSNELGLRRSSSAQNDVMYISFAYVIRT